VTIATNFIAFSCRNISYDQRRIERIHLTAAIPLFAKIFESIQKVKNSTLLITRDPPKRSQRSLGVVTFPGRKLNDPVVIPDIFLNKISFTMTFFFQVNIST
jgi:hypothetical protein